MQSSQNLSMGINYQQLPVMTLSILRQTGLGLKIRFMCALSCLAMIPSFPLAFILLRGTIPPFLSGRNGILFALVVFIATILIATWVALPVIRPIRRATRQLGRASEEITSLAQETGKIAGEQRMGMTIISTSSMRLLGRRQSIIRDCQLIVGSCKGLHDRIQRLFPETRSAAAQEFLLQIKNIAVLANTVATGLEGDKSLAQLEQAMTSAHDFSLHFQRAGAHLQKEARSIEEAAHALL